MLRLQLEWTVSSNLNLCAKHNEIYLNIGYSGIILVQNIPFWDVPCMHIFNIFNILSSLRNKYGKTKGVYDGIKIKNELCHGINDKNLN